VRRRTADRFRDTARRGLHERPRHLRAVERRGLGCCDDAGFHGRRRADDAVDLSRFRGLKGRAALAMLYLILGTLFGFALSRSGAGDYDMIQGMFLFER